MRPTFERLLLPLLSLALASCGSNVSLGDPAPGASNEIVVDDNGEPPDTEPPPPEYPAGPYAKTVGSTIANLEWDGYRDGTGEVTKISLNDYFDPEGKKGIKVIMLKLSALW